MRKLLQLLAGLSWFGLLCFAGWQIYQGTFGNQMPVFAYNRPQGHLGWGITGAGILTLAAVVWPKGK